MTSFSTSRCTDYKHPEFRIDFNPDSVLSSDVAWFAATLENMVASGRCFSDGQSFQIGWSYTLLSLTPAGVLTFREADFKSMPINWHEGLTSTLRHMRLHKDVVESVLPSERLTIPSFRDSCIICSNLRNASHIMMDRNAPKHEDSGWFIGCVDDSHDHNDPKFLNRVSLYEAATVYAPMSLGYFALPPGITVIAGSNSPRIYESESLLSFKKGSYLELMFNDY